MSSVNEAALGLSASRRALLGHVGLVGWVGAGALVGCGGGGGSAPEPLREPGVLTSASLFSAQTGAVYPIEIYVPDSYAASTARYPVIYATDGDAAYPPSGRFTNFRKIMQRRGTAAILVGIGNTARRGTDYTLPGAQAYHRFIAQELVPYIESRYRADPRRRVLSGLSLGGSFVVSAMFLEAPTTLTFSHYVSAEGAFSQGTFRDQEFTVSASLGDKSLPATLILAAGSLLPTTNAAVVSAFHQRLVERRFVDLKVIKTDFAADHVGTDNPSFEDALVRIFE